MGSVSMKDKVSIRMSARAAWSSNAGSRGLVDNMRIDDGAVIS
jgi:hypothetical protein